MSHRTRQTFRPFLELLDTKQLLSAGMGSALAKLESSKTHAPTITSAPSVPLVGVPAATTASHATVSTKAVKPNFGYLVYRITNPNRFNNHVSLPFGHVLVQARKPVPGQVYNILQLTVRNGTAKSFDASSGFTVRFPGQKKPTPILTGNETWKSGQNYTFYVMTKKYYPINNQVTEGFTFNLGGARSVGIPGPSGIFLRVKYNPATINKVLDTIVAGGPGAQGGIGIKYGLPDTAILEFLPSSTGRNDFGGYF